MPRLDEIPGLTFITCSWLEEMGLWDASDCCYDCHVDHPDPFHGLYEQRLPNGQVLAICLQAKGDLDLLEVERKILACDTPELNANDQSN